MFIEYIKKNLLDTFKKFVFDILKYNKHFYETMRYYVSWHVQPGEAYLLERALFTLFNNTFNIKEKYKN